VDQGIHSVTSAMVFVVGRPKRQSQVAAKNAHARVKYSENSGTRNGNCSEVKAFARLPVRSWRESGDSACQVLVEEPRSKITAQVSSRPGTKIAIKCLTVLLWRSGAPGTDSPTIQRTRLARFERAPSISG